MTELIEIYHQNKALIDSFIVSTMKNTEISSSTDTKELRKFFTIFPSLDLIYVVDEQYNQITPNIFKTKEVGCEMNCNRQYLLSKSSCSITGITISEPYISKSDANLCITVTREDYEHLIFFDFNLERLLSRFGLIESHPVFDSISTASYGVIGFGLIVTAAFLVFYAFYLFVTVLFADNIFDMDQIFKSVIALTLGLAIFDLAKTILEQEVFYRSFKRGEGTIRKVFAKFLTSIIIALSIESLMVVFKIALHDYAQMLSAFYLIAGVSLLILSLAIYHKLTSQKSV
ncbi:MAG: hypothetical protein K0U47_10955 [Epsilonproteobacteria bacterium]|nr:hypothetical protein [Campylobacterota bacterium]